MTAFAAKSLHHQDVTIDCEIKSLNGRFIEVNVRMPHTFNNTETSVIKLVKERLNRGSIFVNIKVSPKDPKQALPILNKEAVNHYAQLIDDLQETMQKTVMSSFATLSDPTACELFQLQGILTAPETTGPETEAINKAILSSVSDTLELLVEDRQREGLELANALKTLAEKLRSGIQKISQESERLTNELHSSYIKRLEKTIAAIKEAGGSSILPPEERLAAEITILVDKADIDEEITRFNLHIDAFFELLASADSNGKKLDFLCQELHREINTISSKLSQTSITRDVIDIKQIVEKIRQQVQNIE